MIDHIRDGLSEDHGGSIIAEGHDASTRRGSRRVSHSIVDTIVDAIVNPFGGVHN